MPSKLKPPTRVAFAGRLRAARNGKFSSAKAFADAIGEEAETYRTWERGEREPDITRLVRIANTLNVSLDFLIRGRSDT